METQGGFLSTGEDSILKILQLVPANSASYESRPVQIQPQNNLTALPLLYNIHVMFRNGLPLSVLRAAAACQGVGDFGTVLKALAEACGAQRCILWQRFDVAGSDDRRYFALAEHFPGLNWYYIPAQTFTGIAGSKGRRQVVNDLEAAVADGYPTCERLIDLGVLCFCSIPVELDPKRFGVINFYRDIGADRFTEAEVDRAESLAAAVPHLFSSVMSEIGFRLLHDVEKTLRARGEKGFQEVLENVNKSLGANESAIYLKKSASSDLFVPMATVWPWDWPLTKQYQKDDPGLTGWVLRNGRSIQFFDLAHFDEEKAFRGYSGVVHRTLGKVLDGARKLFGTNDIPPISYISAPIKDFGETIGVFRCCIARKGTHLFDERHLQILEFVADQIGERWGTRMALAQATEERKRFERFAKDIDRLNVSAFREMRLPSRSIRHQLDEALLTFGRLLRCDDALSIRLVGADGNLDLFARHGKRWDSGTQKEREGRLARRFPLQGDCSGSVAIRQREVVIENNCQEPGHHRSELFPEATRLLHAPILVGEKPIGVLDVRGFDSQAFSGVDGQLASLFARQLGVYHNMFESFALLQKQSADLRAEKDSQIQTFDDLHHQLSSPIHRARVFAETAAAAHHPDRDTIRSIRSNVRRAEHVAGNLKHFVALAKGNLLRPELSVLKSQRLVDHLVDLADDQEVLAKYTRSDLRFCVDTPTFECLDSVTVLANFDLLDHAIGNLLDNARKYSHKRTTVLIRASLSRDRKWFWLSVLNQGHKVTTAERLLLPDRGYRGEVSSQRVAEGRGLGLHIAEMLMRSMNGVLSIVPTDSRRMNEFKLGWRTESFGKDGVA